MSTILFRADSSSTIGTGHIMRDLVLAAHYAKQGHTIIFATQDLQGSLKPNMDEARYENIILKSNDIKELHSLIKKCNIDLLVIDHYGIDYAFEKKLKKKNPSLKILAFDDTYQKHYCNILLNHNISANKKKYIGLVPKECELRCGRKYTLLRDEFIKEKKILKKRKKQNNKIKTVFVAMGGADHSNINRAILKVIQKFQNLQVNLVTTRANQNLEALQKYCKNRKWVHLHINSNKIAKLMSKSDFAIITPSVTINEIYYLNIPFIAIKTAENQIDMYHYLKKKSYVVLHEFESMKLESKIFKMLRSVNK